MNGVTKWLTLAFAVLVVVGGAIYAYGQLAGSVGDHERRIGRVERVLEQILETASRTDKTVAVIDARLERIERDVKDLKGRMP